jgi:hypothetical protein
VLLMFLPGGLGELVFRARDRLLRMAADRRGLLVPSLVADRRMAEGAGDAAGEDVTALISAGLAPEAEQAPVAGDGAPRKVAAKL